MFFVTSHSVIIGDITANVTNILLNLRESTLKAFDSFI